MNRLQLTGGSWRADANLDGRNIMSVLSRADREMNTYIGGVVNKTVGHRDGDYSSFVELTIELSFSQLSETRCTSLVTLNEGGGASEVEALRDRKGNRGIADLNQRVRSHSDGEGEGCNKTRSEHSEEVIAEEVSWSLQNLSSLLCPFILWR